MQQLEQELQTVEQLVQRLEHDPIRAHPRLLSRQVQASQNIQNILERALAELNFLRDYPGMDTMLCEALSRLLNAKAEEFANLRDWGKNQATMEKLGKLLDCPPAQVMSVFAQRRRLKKSLEKKLKELSAHEDRLLTAYQRATGRCKPKKTPIPIDEPLKSLKK